MSPSSPTPVSSFRISVSAWRGQPPPGSSASSAAKPVARAEICLARAPPRQMRCRCSIASRAPILYFHTVLGGLARALFPGLQLAQLRLVGRHEIAAEYLVEVFLRFLGEPALVIDERIPELPLLTRQAEAAAGRFLEYLLDRLRIEAAQRAEDGGAHASHQGELVRGQVLAGIADRLHRVEA